MSYKNLLFLPPTLHTAWFDTVTLIYLTLVRHLGIPYPISRQKLIQEYLVSTYYVYHTVPSIKGECQRLKETVPNPEKYLSLLKRPHYTISQSKLYIQEEKSEIQKCQRSHEMLREKNGLSWTPIPRFYS